MLEKDSIKVFIGSASADLKFARSIAKMLSQIGVKPLIWTEANIFVAGVTIYDNLIKVCRDVQGAIFIFGNSDELTTTEYKEGKTFVPRDNVLIEYGLFSAYLNYRRVHIIRYNDTKIASDLAGIVYTDCRNMKYLKEKIEVWLNTNILKDKSKTPFQRYEEALRENERVKLKLALYNDELFKIASKKGIDYETVSDPEKELWKIAFAIPLRTELIQLIDRYHSAEEIVEILKKINMYDYVSFVMYQRIPFTQRLDNTIQQITIGILEGKVTYEQFHALFFSMNSIIYENIFTNVNNIPFFWKGDDRNYRTPG